MSPSKQARSQSGSLLRLSKLQKVAPPQQMEVGRWRVGQLMWKRCCLAITSRFLSRLLTITSQSWIPGTLPSAGQPTPSSPPPLNPSMERCTTPTLTPPGGGAATPPSPLQHWTTSPTTGPLSPPTPASTHPQPPLLLATPQDTPTAHPAPAPYAYENTPSPYSYQGAAPPFSQPLTRGPLRQELGTPETSRKRKQDTRDRTSQ